MAQDEGVIKFNCHWRPGPPPFDDALPELIQIRNLLWQRGWIGENEQGIGFGNCSSLTEILNQIIITCSQTGWINLLGNNGYCLIEEFDLERNAVWAVGPQPPSSEALTHAALYRDGQEYGIRSVLHIHHAPLWHRMLGRWPTTRPEIPYGTPEMAFEMARLLRETDLPTRRVLAMAGHAEGIIAFGQGPLEALTALEIAFLEVLGGIPDPSDTQAGNRY